MRTKVIPIILIALVGQLSACASWQAQPGSEAEQVNVIDQLIALQDSYIKAIEQCKTSAGKLSAIAAFEVGFLKEAVGTDLNRLPAEATKIIDDYGDLGKKFSSSESLTDYEKGQFIGMRWRFLYLVGRWIIETYGQEVFNALKVFLVL